MKILRLTLLLVLSFAVPVAALASVMPLDYCAIQMSGNAGSGHDGNVAAQDKHDCCNHSAGDKSQPCKAGHDCKSPCSSVFQISVVALSLPLIPLEGILVSLSAASPLAHDPDGLWRPPQIL